MRNTNFFRFLRGGLSLGLRRRLLLSLPRLGWNKKIKNKLLNTESGKNKINRGGVRERESDGDLRFRLFSPDGRRRLGDSGERFAYVRLM